jgi:hypothetical protein
LVKEKADSKKGSGSIYFFSAPIRMTASAADTIGICSAKGARLDFFDQECKPTAHVAQTSRSSENSHPDLHRSYAGSGSIYFFSAPMRFTASAADTIGMCW